jgi:hypothetical protein
MTARLERTGSPDSRRIMNEGSVAAMVQQLSSGEWVLLSERGDTRITNARFPTPGSALKWWKEQNS